MRVETLDHKKSVGLGRLSLLGGAILILLGLTQWYSPDPVDLWWQAFFETLHVPVFGFIAVFTLMLTPHAWHWQKRFGVTLAIVVVLSIGSEAAQIPTPRNASLKDLFANISGALAFLCGAAVLSQSIHVPPGRGRYLIILGAIIVIWPLLPFFEVSAAHWQRYAQLPSIAPLASRHSRMLYHLKNAIVVFRQSSENGRISTEVRFGKTGSSSINFHDPWSNWRPYETLVLDLETPDNKPLPLTIRVHDEAHELGDQPHNDRFNRRIELGPGRQAMKISLDDIKNAPAGRDMDMKHIDGLVLFGSDKEAGRRFLIHDVRLE